ncbi:MAG: MarR family transcriptional regulator [Pseudonocardiales bacterium]|nr:MAG: MarR family transcriptional regulator [Pseudonocardiales bacterium]
MTRPAHRGPARTPAPVRRSPRRLASRHAEADDSPGLLLWQVTNRWQAAQRAALKTFDLTHVQFVLLASLTWLDDDAPVTQQHVAQHAATDPMMTSQVLRGLEGRGLIARARHPSDARARAVTVTRAGAALANRAVVAVERCDAEFFAPLARGTARFATQLRALRQHTAH